MCLWGVGTSESYKSGRQQSWMMPSVFLYPPSGGLAFFEGLIAPFFRGIDCIPRTPAAGYDPGRCNAGAWVSAAGCVRLFFGEIFVSSSRFFAEWRNKSFAGLATSGVCRSLLSQLTIPPNPLNFFYYQSMFSTEPNFYSKIYFKLFVINKL